MPAAATDSISSGTRTTLSINEYSVCSRRCTKVDFIARPASIALERAERFADRKVLRQAPEAELAAEPGSERIEAAAVNRGRSQPHQSLEVRAGRVAEMLIQSVAGIAAIELLHQRIAMGLGDDRCGADAGHERIASHHGFDATITKAIMELWRTVTVNYYAGGPLGQRQQRPLHRKQRCLQDVEEIDLSVIGLGDGNPERALTNAQRQHRAPLGRELLRVGQAAYRPLGIEYHRGSHDRTGERSASSLIDARDQLVQSRWSSPYARGAIEAQLRLPVLRHFFSMSRESPESGPADARAATDYRVTPPAPAPSRPALPLPAETRAPVAPRPTSSEARSTAAAPSEGSAAGA